nr:hypothetical protein [Lachnospiraceae bacterium]
SLNIPTPKKVNEFNKAYEEYADSKDNVYFYDYSDVLKDDEGYLKGSCDAGDGCHWNSGATNEVAEKIKEFDKETFK